MADAARDSAAAVRSCGCCGGRGVGLVKRGGFCLHCTRVRNMAEIEPCELVRKQLENGFFDVSPDATYSLLKRVKRAGDGRRGRLEPGCPAQIHVVGRTWDEETATWSGIFETTRDVVDGKHAGGTDDTYEVVVGRFTRDAVDDELRKQAMDPMHVALGRCRAWDPCLLSMSHGEVAEFVCSPELAYGAEGYPPKVLPHEHVLFEFELVDWLDSLPPMPSREEMERSRLEREEEERRRLAENPPPSFEERLAASNRDRESGNELFRAGKFEEARKSYDAAFVGIFYSNDEYNYALDEAQRREVDQAKLLLHLNRAMAKTKLNQPSEALWDCNKALELDAGNAKGLYRRCLAHCGRLELELEKEARGEFWVVEKAWEILRAAREDLRQLIELQAPAAGEDAQASSSTPVKVDASVAAARKRVKALEQRLLQYTKDYRKQEKNLFQNKIWKQVERENEAQREHEHKMSAERAREQAEVALADMPALDD